jgi:hypothetical protein
VRLDFDGLSEVQKSKLLAWAQLSAIRWQGWSLPGSSVWQWAVCRFDDGLHLAASTSIQQAIEQ